MMQINKMPENTTGKYWIELRVEIHPSLAEAAANYLIEQGSPGIIQETVKGSAGCKRERLIGYYPDDQAFPVARKTIHAYLRAICKSRRTNFKLSARSIREEKWAEAWMKNFKPIEVTPKLVIKPPWESWPKKQGQIVIEIDPGMAFGTGTHPSTQMCLQFLEEVIPSLPGNPSVLDVGTGSGILTIAARKMGVKKIAAIDIDPVAVACARANARANRAGRGISFRTGAPDVLKASFDLVVANLLPQELLSAAPALARLAARSGKLVVSGFLARQEKEIAAAFRRHGLEKQSARRQKGWAAWVLQRSP
jgi:ribosomal protein L11 methyltransferase